MFSSSTARESHLKRLVLQSGSPVGTLISPTGLPAPSCAVTSLITHELYILRTTALSLAITPQPRQSRPERLASRTTWKKAHYTASRHPHFEAAPEGARRRTCKGEQQRFPREDCRLSAYQAAEAYRLTACSGRLWRSENALPVNPPLYILRRIGRIGRSLRLWMQACGQAFMVRGCAGFPS